MNTTYRWVKAKKEPPSIDGYNWKNFTCRLIGQTDTFMMRVVKTKNHFYWETSQPELMEYLEEVPPPSETPSVSAEERAIDILEKHVGSNALMEYKPMKTKDVLAAMHEFAGQFAPDLKPEMSVQEKRRIAEEAAYWCEQELGYANAITKNLEAYLNTKYPLPGEKTATDQQ